MWDWLVDLLSGRSKIWGEKMYFRRYQCRLYGEELESRRLLADDHPDSPGSDNLVQIPGRIVGEFEKPNDRDTFVLTPTNRSLVLRNTGAEIENILVERGFGEPVELPKDRFVFRHASPVQSITITGGGIAGAYEIFATHTGLFERKKVEDEVVGQIETPTEPRFYSYGLESAKIYEWNGSENIALSLYDAEFRLLSKQPQGTSLVWMPRQDQRVYLHVEATEDNRTFTLTGRTLDSGEMEIPTFSGDSKIVGDFDSHDDVDLFFVDVGERDGTLVVANASDSRLAIRGTILSLAEEGAFTVGEEEMRFPISESKLFFRLDADGQLGDYQIDLEFFPTNDFFDSAISLVVDSEYFGKTLPEVDSQFFSYQLSAGTLYAWETDAKAEKWLYDRHQNLLAYDESVDGRIYWRPERDQLVTLQLVSPQASDLNNFVLRSNVVEPTGQIIKANDFPFRVTEAFTADAQDRWYWIESTNQFGVLEAEGLVGDFEQIHFRLISPGQVLVGDVLQNPHNRVEFPILVQLYSEQATGPFEIEFDVIATGGSDFRSPLSLDNDSEFDGELLSIALQQHFSYDLEAGVTYKWEGIDADVRFLDVRGNELEIDILNGLPFFWFAEESERIVVEVSAQDPANFVLRQSTYQPDFATAQTIHVDQELLGPTAFGELSAFDFEDIYRFEVADEQQHIIVADGRIDLELFDSEYKLRGEGRVIPGQTVSTFFLPREAGTYFARVVGKDRESISYTKPKVYRHGDYNCQADAEMPFETSQLTEETVLLQGASPSETACNQVAVRVEADFSYFFRADSSVLLYLYSDEWTLIESNEREIFWKAHEDRVVFLRASAVEIGKPYTVRISRDFDSSPEEPHVVNTYPWFEQSFFHSLTDVDSVLLPESCHKTYEIRTSGIDFQFNNTKTVWPDSRENRFLFEISDCAQHQLDYWASGDSDLDEGYLHISELEHDATEGLRIRPFETISGFLGKGERHSYSYFAEEDSEFQLSPGYTLLDSAFRPVNGNRLTGGQDYHVQLERSETNHGYSFTLSVYPCGQSIQLCPSQEIKIDEEIEFDSWHGSKWLSFTLTSGDFYRVRSTGADVKITESSGRQIDLPLYVTRQEVLTAQVTQNSPIPAPFMIETISFAEAAVSFPSLAVDETIRFSPGSNTGWLRVETEPRFRYDVDTDSPESILIVDEKGQQIDLPFESDGFGSFNIHANRFATGTLRVFKILGSSTRENPQRIEPGDHNLRLEADEGDVWLSLETEPTTNYWFGATDFAIEAFDESGNRIIELTKPIGEANVTYLNGHGNSRILLRLSSVGSRSGTLRVVELNEFTIAAEQLINDYPSSKESAYFIPTDSDILGLINSVDDKDVFRFDVKQGMIYSLRTSRLIDQQIVVTDADDGLVELPKLFDSPQELFVTVSGLDRRYRLQIDSWEFSTDIYSDVQQLENALVSTVSGRIDDRDSHYFRPLVEQGKRYQLHVEDESHTKDVISLLINGLEWFEFGEVPEFVATTDGFLTVRIRGRIGTEYTVALLELDPLFGQTPETAIPIQLGQEFDSFLFPVDAESITLPSEKVFVLPTEPDQFFRVASIDSKRPFDSDSWSVVDEFGGQKTLNWQQHPDYDFGFYSRHGGDVFITVGPTRSPSTFRIDELVDEHGDTPAQATEIVLPTTLEGNLRNFQVSGSFPPEDTDAQDDRGLNFDWFRFEVPKAGAIRTTRNRTLDEDTGWWYNILEVFDSDAQTRVGRADSSRTLSIPAAGTYFIRMRAGSQRHSESYNISLEYIPDDLQNSLDSPANIAVDNSYHDVGMDWYKLPVDSQYNYVVNAPDDAGRSPPVTTLDENGELLTGVERIPESLGLYFTPTAEQEIILRTDSRLNRPYKLSVLSFADPAGNSLRTAAQLTIDGEDINEHLVVNDEDWFEFSAIEDQVYRFEFDTPLNARIVDSLGNVWFDSSAQSKVSTLDWQAVRSDTYLLQLSRSYGKNDAIAIPYRLSGRSLFSILHAPVASPPPIDPEPDDWQDALAISVGQETAGTIYGGQDQDWFQIDVRANTSYAVTSTSSSLRILDERGALQNGGSSDFLWRPETPGKFYVGFFGDTEHDYSFHIRDVHSSEEFVPSISAGIRVTQFAGAGDEEWYRLETRPGLAYRISFAGIPARIFNRSAVEIPTTFVADGSQVFILIDAYLPTQKSYDFRVDVPYGDANLDGVFDSTDFVQIFQTGEYEDEVFGNSEWHEGDWNGDGEFDSSDLILAFRNGDFEQSPMAASRTKDHQNRIDQFFRFDDKVFAKSQRQG